MSYTDTAGRFVREDVLTLQASGAKTTTGTSTGILLGHRRSVSLLLDVTVRSGTTPTLDVVVQTSNDNSTWRTLVTFAQATAVSSARMSAGGADRYVRLSYTIGGTTPSFTFSVTGVAV